MPHWILTAVDHRSGKVYPIKIVVEAPDERKHARTSLPPRLDSRNRILGLILR